MARFKTPRRRKSTGRAEWEQLRPVVQALVESVSPDQAIADQSIHILRAKPVGLWRVDRSRDELDLIAQRGFDEGAVTELRRVPLSAPCLIARAVRTKQTVEVLNAPEGDDESAPWRCLAEQEGWGSILALPLFASGRTIGVLTCIKETPQPYGHSERALIEALGDRSTIAIVHAGELASATEELREVNQQLTISNVRAQELSEEAEAARDRVIDLSNQLRTALQVRDEFMAAAAHELRSSITVIRGRAQLLLRNDANETGVRQSLDAILTQAG